MRYRKLDTDLDMRFGRGTIDVHRDTPDAVAQSVLTRLQLYRGEWFLDAEEGMPWKTDVLGHHTAPTRDLAVRRRILETEGVTSIDSYSSNFDPSTRRFSVNVTISTVYGVATVSGVI